MKTCPVCEADLATEKYENVTLWRCARCKGAFVAKYKLEIIRHSRDRDSAALKIEAHADFTSDTRSKLRCPRCNAKMTKRAISGTYGRVMKDHCRDCDGIWLDGGELAVAQLVFEASTRGRESVEFQQRMKDLSQSPERRAQFEADLAALPERLPGEMSERNDDALGRALIRAITRGARI